MRNRALSASHAGLLAFGVAMAALAGVIGLELRGRVPHEPPTSVDPVGWLAEVSPVPASGDVPSDQASRRVATILARPLFSPNRRPDKVASDGARTGLARLTGIIVSSAGKSAIFAGAAGSKAAVVGEGARIGLYLIESIDAGGVTIVGPNGQRVLHPTFDPSAGPKVAVPARAVQTATLPVAK